MQLNRPAQAQPSFVTTAEFGAKFRTKREIYNFLTVEVGAFLPAHQTVTVYFLRDLLTGKKKGRFSYFEVIAL